MQVGKWAERRVFAMMIGQNCDFPMVFIALLFVGPVP